jgi:peptide chain release factor 3
MNKLDRPTKDPLALLDELEQVLQIGAVPMNWPLGTGFEFRGVFDRQAQQVHFYEMTPQGAYRAPVEITGLDDPIVRERLPEESHRVLLEELQMLDHAGEVFDADAVAKGRMTPVFFGSARNNFGVQLLLDGFLKLAGPPRPRSVNGAVVPMEGETFSGFVFKIQANMDPKHRDRIAFIRVCSGKFIRDMSVLHTRSGKRLRLSSASKVLGQARETIDEAYPGDIVGIVGQSALGIGDTLTEDASVVYNEIPHFPPEYFAALINPFTGNYKKFRDGVEQLLQEGVVQGLQLTGTGQRVPILGAVGPLQFEVVQYRLENEYGAPTQLEMKEWKLLRWLDPSIDVRTFPTDRLPTGCALAENAEGQHAILFVNEWALNYFKERQPQFTLSELPFGA